MLSQLPERADPIRLCESDTQFEGVVKLHDLQRLGAFLTSTEGEMRYSFLFTRDVDRRRVIKGHVEGELQIICQRCLGAMPLPIDSDWQLAVVTGFQQAEQLPEEYDPLLVEEDTIVLRDLIEDELILAVPSAARHEPDQCAVQLTDYQEEVEEETEAPEASDNPFAVLAQMKSKGSDVN